MHFEYKLLIIFELISTLLVFLILACEQWSWKYTTIDSLWYDAVRQNYFDFDHIIGEILSLFYFHNVFYVTQLCHVITQALVVAFLSFFLSLLELMTAELKERCGAQLSCTFKMIRLVYYSYNVKGISDYGLLRNHPDQMGR